MQKLANTIHKKLAANNLQLKYLILIKESYFTINISHNVLL
jgi:hypothetical protein